MIEGVSVAGLFILACTLQDIDPLTGNSVSEPHPASLVARDGIGAFTGWAQVAGQGRISVRRLTDGTIIMSGMTLEKSSEETWAVLTPIQKTDRFDMRWLVQDPSAAKGSQASLVWSKGECHQLGKAS
jgi:hypothetical protein